MRLCWMHDTAGRYVLWRRVKFPNVNGYFFFLFFPGTDSGQFESEDENCMPVLARFALALETVRRIEEPDDTVLSHAGKA